MRSPNGERVGGAAAPEGILAGDRLVEHDSERENVRSRIGACAAQRPPTLAEERAFLDTLRARSAARLVQYRKEAAERESIYAGIDRTRVARIRELDALLGQRAGTP